MNDNDRLNGRDPMDVLKSTMASLAKIVDDHDANVLRARPYEGKWTPTEILGHLVDHEIVCTCRIRTLRFESEVWVGHYDQETWVQVQGHRLADSSVILPRFAFLRDLNVAQYESLTELEWRQAKPRSGGEGDISLEQLVRQHAEHDLTHLDQLTRYLEAIRS